MQNDYSDAPPLTPILPLTYSRRLIISLMQWFSNIVFFACSILALVDIATKSAYPPDWLFGPTDKIPPGYIAISSSFSIIVYGVLLLVSAGVSAIAAFIEIRIYGMRYVGMDLNWTLPIQKTVEEALVKMSESMTRAKSSFSLYGKSYQFYFFFYPLCLLLLIVCVIIVYATNKNVIMVTPCIVIVGMFIFLYLFICLTFQTYGFLSKYHVWSPQNEAEFAKYIYDELERNKLERLSQLEYMQLSRDELEDIQSQSD